MRAVRLLRRVRHRAVVGLFSLTPHARTRDLTRLGSDYGGWWIPLDAVGSDAVCYLAGVGTDVSFDVELISCTGASAWGIDPTPRSMAWVAGQDIDPRWSLVPVGVAGQSGLLRFYEPAAAEHSSYSMKNLQNTADFVECEVLTIRDLMARLGHDRIDVLKLDVEGAEHDTINTMLKDDIKPRVLCVEFDQPEPVWWSYRTLRRLNRAGYRVAKVDGLNFTLVARAT